MKKQTLFVAILSALSLSATAQDTGPNWGNPYDLWIGGVTYQSNGTAGPTHNGTHGNTVTGGSYSVCNGRLQDAIASHASEPQVSMTGCYLKTTVLFQPALVADDPVTNSNSDNPIWAELDALKLRYNLSGFSKEIQALEQKYNIESFRTEFEALYIKSITDPNTDPDAGYISR
ncbi:hypothetical protein [Aliikangiella sp. G2MR2-5]|uniref:hypothetical protein n=1 Tax=Aliikangiella sp. G2MR2-5 TaxID=2788943 RepID=UPI0018AA884C|nr:hypothetical protein [Aliikangiella sp. G2MR2-5]